MLTKFSYKREEGQNPYTGIMSFQHFRGEKMYSDIVVRPEANRTETERVECYPVSPDAEENGRSEGYYPDTSIVYIRILWKEFEPRRGEYNYSFIEDILNKAKSHGQSLLFRLMAHSTRAEDDVPEWLKELIPCPERPAGKREKASPKDPLFLDLFLEAVRKFGERFDSDPTLDGIDISLPGAWGEGYQLAEYPEHTLERIVDVYTEVFKHTQLIGQASRPELIRYAERVATVGWRGDGLGEPEHTFEKYPEKVEKIADVWTKAPVSFESFWWLCEWQRQGWDIDRIIESTLSWHLSSFNPKSMPIPMEWKDKIDLWVAKMGYHYTVDEVELADKIKAGQSLTASIRMSNVGVAPIYKDVALVVRLTRENDSYYGTSDADLRSWLPGQHSTAVTIALPEGITPGSYSLELGIFASAEDAYKPSSLPFIYLATDAQRRGAFYTIGSVEIS